MNGNGVIPLATVKEGDPSSLLTRDELNAVDDFAEDLDSRVSCSRVPLRASRRESDVISLATDGSEQMAPIDSNHGYKGDVGNKTFWEKVLQMRYAPRELYIIFSIKLAESTAYFAFSYIYAPFLSDEFGLSDVEAGIVYALYGVLCSVFGLCAGPAIDALDLRTALLVGTIPSFLGRFGSAVTTSTRFVCLCSVTLLPIGAAFGLPVFALGVRRFTHPETRAFAFTIFYAVLCASCALGGFVITLVRSYFYDGIVVMGMELSWMRVNVLVTGAMTLYTCFAACFVRNMRMQQDVPVEIAQLEPYVRKYAGLRATFRVVYGSQPFWRLLGLSLIVAIGTRATFRHLDATFPKYFMRMYGDDAPFEVFVAIEPVMTMLLSFPVTFYLLRRRVSTFKSLVGGTIIQSFCPLALAWTSYGSATVFVLLMSLGDSIWSPRLYEYSTMVAPEGFEGTFVAITFVPQYVAAGVVGISSGYMLDRFVPSDEELATRPGESRHPEIMWCLIAAASFLSPILLILGRRRLFVEEGSTSPDGSASHPDAGPAVPIRRVKSLGKVSSYSAVQMSTPGKPLPEEYEE